MAGPRECARCEKVRRIVGRKLCNPCYKWLTKNNQLDLFPIRKGNEPFVEIRLDQNGDQIKQCTKCKEWKVLSSFGRNPQSSIGYKSWCNECRIIKGRNQYAPKKKAIREAKQDAYQDGLKRCKECKTFKSIESYTHHPDHWDRLSHVCRECANKHTKEVYTKNRDKLLKQSREWYKANKEHRYQTSVEWRKNNPDKSRSIWHRYKSNKLNAEGDFTVEQWEKVKSYYCPDGSCLDCGEKRKLTFDHVIPLSKGGSNYIDNIQPLCGNCNSKKSNHHATDFRPDKGEFARSLLDESKDGSPSVRVGR